MFYILKLIKKLYGIATASYGEKIVYICIPGIFCVRIHFYIVLTVNNIDLINRKGLREQSLFGKYGKWEQSLSDRQQ